MAPRPVWLPYAALVFLTPGFSGFCPRQGNGLQCPFGPSGAPGPGQDGDAPRAVRGRPPLRRRHESKARRPGRPSAPRPVPRALSGGPSNYFTTTVFTADVLDADRWVTRTGILYFPFLVGAFHFSE